MYWGRYIAARDADRLTKLQTIAAAGLELSPIEADSLAAGASYLELRLLERITSGRIKAPSLTVFEQDLKDLRVKASGLQHYRGSLAAINPGTGLFGGVSGKTGLGAGMSSLIAGNWLSAGLDEMTRRWATLETRE